MSAATSNKKTILWLEGLRGIVSVLVVLTHISRAWDYDLFSPANEAGQPRLLQLPIIRVPAQGRIGVPLFAFLTGFVCAAKPLRLAYENNQQHAALMSMARSAFRRPIRLILPAAFATFLSFLASTVGGYNVANVCDNMFIRYDSPSVLPLRQNIHRLFRALLLTWTTGENFYDRHQWAMRPLLIGAFQVYLYLFATMGLRFRYRIIVNLLLMVYWWLDPMPKTETFGSLLALGTLVAELSQHQPTQSFIRSRARFLSYFISPAILFLGLYLGSYPDVFPDRAQWSKDLRDIFVRPDEPEGHRGSWLIPEGADVGRRFSSIGMQLCLVALFLAPKWQEALCHKVFLWFGRRSFAVYLVHGTLLRTVGVWIVYGMSSKVKADQKHLHPRGGWYIATSVIIFVALTYAAAWAWVRWVDTACARFTAWLEGIVFREDKLDVNLEKQIGLLPR